MGKIAHLWMDPRDGARERESTDRARDAPARAQRAAGRRGRPVARRQSPLRGSDGAAARAACAYVSSITEATELAAVQLLKLRWRAVV